MSTISDGRYSMSASPATCVWQRRTRALVLLAAICLLPRVSMAAKDSSRAPVDSSQQIAARIVESPIPVVVDFWAAWCGPCKMVSPTIKALAKEYKGRVDFLKIDVDRHTQIARYFGVSSIPMIFVISDKTVRKALPGVRSKQEYKRAIDEVLAMDAAADSAGQDSTDAKKKGDDAAGK
ncbi:MAG: thioredoxin [Chitinivibrionales bacterium]|nr:thioredoxin [Chitinivibrionales bacterium]